MIQITQSNSIRVTALLRRFLARPELNGFEWLFGSPHRKRRIEPSSPFGFLLNAMLTWTRHRGFPHVGLSSATSVALD
jgi:hypothetical protein